MSQLQRGMCEMGEARASAGGKNAALASGKATPGLAGCLNKQSGGWSGSKKRQTSRNHDLLENITMKKGWYASVG